MKKVSIMLLAGIITLFAACKSEKNQKTDIKTIKATEALVYGENKTVTFPGKVKASSDINLSFRISGPISKIHVKEGEFVRKGQILAEMDDRDYKIQFSATEAEYNQIKGEAERIIKLYEQESVSENDYEKAIAGLQQITAKYNAHKNALADTKLTAPFDGYVQKRWYDKDETISAGMPVFSVISTGEPEIIVNIPAGDFIQRDKFDTFTCSFDIYPETIFPLDLISINQKANLNQLYTMRLKLRANGNKSLPTPGMSTMVSILFKPENSHLVSIPMTAIFEKNGQSAVWVYNPTQQTVQFRPVKLSEILTDGTVVISDGLQAGETVVSAGVHTLQDGEHVKLLPEISQTNVGGML
ncbi:efflux RND transporter periplasmic adaptor subunit [Paludibacteraceae bacterium OttesenSCG-928-F17]|nr:efflux RND transporter periplasmic adaptor subunit [Paludibacteraceae bacterium OttesenSCG-928-F17]